MAKPQAPDCLAPLKDLLKSPQTPGGAWLLCGPESYLSAHYLLLLRKKVIPDPELGYFDHIRIRGSDKGAMGEDESLADRLSAAAEGLPVMNEGKLIEISEPDFIDMKATELADFCAVIARLEELPYVTVAILCAEEEFPTTVYRAEQGTAWRALEKSGMHIVPFPLQTEAKLIPWCGKHFASEGIHADPGVISSMIARVGYKMTTLSGEMQKLCCYLHAHGRNTVSPEDIPHVCSAMELAGEFDLRNAIYSRDMDAILRVYRIRKNERVDARVLFYQIAGDITTLYRIKTGLADGYSKEELMKLYSMAEYPMRLAVSACAKYSAEALSRLAALCEETDVKLKSSPIDPYVPVERLLCALSGRFENAVSENA